MDEVRVKSLAGRIACRGREGPPTSFPRLVPLIDDSHICPRITLPPEPPPSGCVYTRRGGQPASTRRTVAELRVWRSAPLVASGDRRIPVIAAAMDRVCGAWESDII